MQNEYEIASMEAHEAQAEEEYFEVRIQLDNLHSRKIFEAGFERAWKMKELQGEKV